MPGASANRENPAVRQGGHHEHGCGTQLQLELAADPLDGGPVVGRVVPQLEECLKIGDRIDGRHNRLARDRDRSARRDERPCLRIELHPLNPRESGTREESEQSRVAGGRDATRHPPNILAVPRGMNVRGDQSKTCRGERETGGRCGAEPVSNVRGR